MTRKYTAVGLLVSAMSAPLWAADPEPIGVYAGISGGLSKLRESQNLCNAFAGVAGATVTDCKTTAFGIRAFAGYMVNH